VLSLASFVGAALRGTTLSDCRMEETRFDGATLSRACVTGCTETHASFAGCDLMWTNTARSTFRRPI